MVLVHSWLQLGLKAAKLAAITSIECVAGMLVHNYRSHRRLLELPSRLYYVNQLMASADSKLVTAPFWNELQKPDRSALYFRSLQPLQFVSLATLEFTRPPGSSMKYAFDDVKQCSRHSCRYTCSLHWCPCEHWQHSAVMHVCTAPYKIVLCLSEPLCSKPSAHLLWRLGT